MGLNNISCYLDQTLRDFLLIYWWFVIKFVYEALIFTWSVANEDQQWEEEEDGRVHNDDEKDTEDVIAVWDDGRSATAMIASR